MDFDQLETFLEVARLVSFSRAAEKRFRTQPAISAQIRALEDEIGTKLLDRSGGRVSLTLPGKVFQKYAEDALGAGRTTIASDGRDGTRAAWRDRSGGQRRPPACTSCRRSLPSSRSTYPDVAVSIERPAGPDPGVHHRQLGGFRRGVVAGQRQPLTVVPIHRDELMIIVAPQHPLAKTKSRPYGRRATIPAAGPAQGGPHPRRHRECSSTNANSNRTSPWNWIPANCSSALWPPTWASGFIARSSVVEDVRAKVLAAIPLADAQIRRDLALVFRKDKALSRAALAFIDIAVKLKNLSTAPASPRSK